MKLALKPRPQINNNKKTSETLPFEKPVYILTELFLVQLHMTVSETVMDDVLVLQQCDWKCYSQFADRYSEKR